ncbi:MAG: GtrA family protein [Oscillospiraceae bacterium]|nr:GtrA family protein [Oscillospiraceae bacterium]
MDIFDKIMSISFLSFMQPWYKKNKEILLYLFFGGLTFLVSIGSYSLFCIAFGMNELIANLISWVLAVAFAYVTNRIWVFNSNQSSVKGIIYEILCFCGGRIVTLLIEEAILFVFITLLAFNSIVVKVVAQIIVIILNYVISKIVVFKEKNK